MLGPLPFLHRAVLVTAVLLTAIAAGAWVAHFTPLPVARPRVRSSAGSPVSWSPYFFVHRLPPPPGPRRR